MSKPEGRCDLVFEAGREDLSCARPLSDSEFERLCSWLDARVAPILLEAAGVFERNPGVCTALRRRPGWLVLEVIWPRGLDGKLSFSVHRSFAPLVERLPVFWSGTVWNGSRTISIASGRLDGTDDPAEVQNAADAFVSVFLTALPG